jgi:hypothetical protein
MPALGQVRGHIVLTDFTGPRGEVYAGYGLTQLTTGNWGAYVENDWTQCDLSTKWNEAQTNLAHAAADTSGALYVTYTSANCSPFGAGPADMAGGYSGGTGENQRLTDYLTANTPSHTGLLRMDYPGYGAIAAILALDPGATPSGPITSGIAGKCLDDYYDSTSAGAVVDIYGLQRHGRTDLAGPDRRHGADQRLVPRRHRPGHQCRDQGRAVELQRRREPTVERRAERLAGRRAVGALSGRSVVDDDGRHAGADLEL